MVALSRECARLHQAVYDMAHLALRNYNVALEVDDLVAKGQQVQLETEDVNRNLANELTTMTERVHSGNRELIVRNEQLEKVQNQHTAKSMEVDKLTKELSELRYPANEPDRDTSMSVDDVPSGSSSTATLRELEVGKGMVKIQSRPGKSELIYSRGVIPSTRVSTKAVRIKFSDNLSAFVSGCRDAVDDWRQRWSRDGYERAFPTDAARQQDGPNGHEAPDLASFWAWGRKWKVRLDGIMCGILETCDYGQRDELFAHLQHPEDMTPPIAACQIRGENVLGTSYLTFEPKEDSTGNASNEVEAMTTALQEARTEIADLKAKNNVYGGLMARADAEVKHAKAAAETRVDDVKIHFEGLQKVMERELMDLKLQKASLEMKVTVMERHDSRIDELCTAWGDVRPMLERVLNSYDCAPQYEVLQDPEEQPEGNIEGQFDMNPDQYLNNEQEEEIEQFEEQVKDSNNNDPLLGGQAEDVVPQIGGGIDMPEPDPSLTTQEQPEAMDEAEASIMVVQGAVIEDVLGPVVTEADESFGAL